MINNLEKIYCRKYRVSFVVVQPLSFDSYPFHLIRGVFGKVTHDEVCVNRSLKSCTRCNHAWNCPYTELFEITLPNDHPLSGKYTNPPVPYILYPDLGGRYNFVQGDVISIELTLIGKAIEYDTFLLHCLQQISFGEGRLYQKLQCTGIETMMGDNRKSHLRFDTASEKANHLKVSFISPVILKTKDNPITSLPFELLSERLSERIALLSYLYCDGDLPDFKSFVKNIETGYNDNFMPVKVEISDGGQKETPPKSGLIGSVAYHGKLGEYLPLVRAGEILHLGGYPNYGLGKFIIDEVFDN